MGSLAMSSAFQETPTPAYKVSKTALNMLTVQYAEAFRDEGVTFIALCPGVCLLGLFYRKYLC